ncbi:MAG: PPOX class F420-dependent oxidoreductase [Candidatus Limnocylindria bacterium]
MSVFEPMEIEFLLSQQHGRLATVGADGQPHVVPVAFRFDEELDVIDVGGPIVARTKKFRDAQRNSRVTFLVDDILPPWRPRGIEIRGEARILPAGGNLIHEGFSPDIIRITPRRIVVWGVKANREGSARNVTVVDSSPDGSGSGP